MAIGDGWVDGAWVDAGWEVGAWQVGAAAVVAFVSTTAIVISIGIQSFVLLLGRTLIYTGEWW